MEQGDEHRRHIPLGKPPAGRGVEAIEEHLAVGDHRPLRLPGGAGGIEDTIGVFGIRLRPRRLRLRRLRQARVIIQGPLDGGALDRDACAHVYLGPQLRQGGGEFGPAQQRLGPAVLDDIGQLPRRQPPVQRRQYGPDLTHGIEEVDVDDTVVRQNRYPVPLFHAQAFPQEMRQTIGAGIQGGEAVAPPARQLHQGLPFRRQ